MADVANEEIVKQIRKEKKKKKKSQGMDSTLNSTADLSGVSATSFSRSADESMEADNLQHEMPSLTKKAKKKGKKILSQQMQNSTADLSGVSSIDLNNTHDESMEHEVPSSAKKAKKKEKKRLLQQMQNSTADLSGVSSVDLDNTPVSIEGNCYALYEHAAGYALFHVAEFEEISATLPKLQKNISNISKFRNIVNLVSFQPFKTGRDALENMNSVSEGILHPHLQLFLENNVPKSKGKQLVVLGVAESKLASAITESLGINCSISGPVPEIIRGIRFHFHKLVKGFKDLSAANKTQLGLGHHYSRARVKFNVNRIDNMIIQAIHIVDQLDKDINTFSMRVREWYSHHFPELIKIVPENHLYIKCVGTIRDRKEMPEDIEQKLEDILMDSNKAQNVIEVARSSMGMEISPLDMENVTLFAERISSLIEKRKELIEYLRAKMQSVAPNLANLIGDAVGARLIAQAGSLTSLAKFPASTIQILGAEKALFRALRTRGNTPKYGLIYHSTFIGRAGKANKGRMSRYLANKCAVATRIDCFRELPTTVFGEKLRQQCEDRLKFLDTGEIPAKNVDVMAEAVIEADGGDEGIAKQIVKAKKKEKKRKSQAMDSIVNSTADLSGISATSLNNDEDESMEAEMSMGEIKPKKKNKKRKSEEMDNSTLNSTADSSLILNGTLDEQTDGGGGLDAKERKRIKMEKKKAKKMKLQLEMSV